MRGRARFAWTGSMRPGDTPCVLPVDTVSVPHVLILGTRGLARPPSDECRRRQTGSSCSVAAASVQSFCGRPVQGLSGLLLASRGSSYGLFVVTEL